METMTDAVVCTVTDDDIHLLESTHDMLEAACDGRAETIDMRRLARELDSLLHRWARERRESRS